MAGTSPDTHLTVDAEDVTPLRPRLTRSRDDRVIAGVAAGIARHIGIDPTLIRIAFVLLAFADGAGVLGYLIAWLIIPEAADEDAAGRSDAPPVEAPLVRLGAGIVFIVVGTTWLINEYVPGLGRATWPLALVALGLVIIVAGARR